MAKVSILIPTYNVEPYLRECLDSIIKQTLKDLEIICINDGSTDNSLSIIQEYAKKDNRIIIITGPNGGYGKAMNKGLDRATGDYIGIVEPDDYIDLDMYRALYEKAEESQVDLIKADFWRFTCEPNGNKHLVYNNLSNVQEDYGLVICPIEEQRCFRFIMNTWSGIYKRSFIEQHHIRHNETPGASYQDNGFWFQTFVYAKRILLVNQPYYYNRRDNPTSSMFNRQKVYCMNEEYKHIRNILIDNCEIWEKVKFTYSFKRYQNYIGTMNRISNEFKKQYILDISHEFRVAEQLGELSPETFLQAEWNSLLYIKNDPENYYLQNILPSIKEHQLIRELDELRSSTTFKVGRIIMFIPCKIKEFFIKRH